MTLTQKYETKFLSEEEFNKFSIAYPLQNSFFQSSYWGKLKKITGWDYEFFAITKNKEVIGASLLLSKKIKGFKKKVYYAPRGYLIDYNNYDLLSFFHENLVANLKKKAMLIKINPYVFLNDRGLNGEIEEALTTNLAIENLKKLGYVHNGLNIGTGQDLEPRFISDLNLQDENINDLFKNFSTNHKRCIKKSLKNCLTLEFIKETESEKLNKFKDIMQSTADRRGYIDRSVDYYLNFLKVFNKEKQYAYLALVKINFKEYREQIRENIADLQIQLNGLSLKKVKQIEEVNVRIKSLQQNLESLDKENLDEKYLSAGVFMGYGSKMFYLFGGNLKEYMMYNSAFFLQYKMIEYALNHNYETYDFYGISGNFDKEHQGYGVFDFKRGFNAQVKELIGEFDYIIDRKSFFIYNRGFKLYRSLKNLMVKK